MRYYSISVPTVVQYKMSRKLSIHISGPALSLLLFDNLKNSHSQEGFLIGNLVETRTDKITDNDRPETDISEVIRIKTSVPCPKPGYFYNGAGDVDIDQLAFLGDLSSKVVGWFKFVSGSPRVKLTFRETLIHKQLASLFSLSNEFFSCCLLSREESDNKALYTCSQRVLRFRYDQFEEVQMQIVNLDNPYNEALVTKSDLTNVKKKKRSTVRRIRDIQNDYEKKLKETVSDLVVTEKKLFQLELEVKELQKKQFNEFK